MREFEQDGGDLREAGENTAGTYRDGAGLMLKVEDRADPKITGPRVTVHGKRRVSASAAIPPLDLLTRATARMSCANLPG